MASYPIDLQPPNMVVLEEKVFVDDHYNIRAESTRHRIEVFLEPLIQEIKTLWKHGVEMWAELV